MYTANKALQVMTKDIHISLLNHDINTVCCKKPLLQYRIEIYNKNKSISRSNTFCGNNLFL